MAEHRAQYKHYSNGTREQPITTACKLFDKYDIKNCRIELEELYPCNSKIELNKREGEHIRNSICVNRKISGQTKKEYWEENKTKLHEKQKQYREDNKESIRQGQKEHRNNNKKLLSEKKKIYRQANKETIQAKDRLYHDLNKEAINEKRRQQYFCDCGKVLSNSNKARHQKSLTHQQYLNSLSQEESPTTP